jgi:hypothetical protein
MKRQYEEGYVWWRYLVRKEIDEGLETEGDGRGRQYKGVFDMSVLGGLASEPGSGQPELCPERPEALFDVFAPTEPG